MLVNDRFARHRLIQGFDQALVQALHIGLVGAGAIGNEVLKNLLLMGVGAVDIYDFDTVELSNLTRSVFLRESDIGQNKAQAVAARAQELHPDTQLKAIAGDIALTLSLSQLGKYDTLVCAVDNLEARLRLNEMALITASDWINLGIDARHSVVEVFANRGLRAPGQTYALQACYACGLPESAFERLQARYSCGGLQRAAFLEKTVPTTVVTASVVAAQAVSQALRLAHTRSGQANTWHPLPGQGAWRIFTDTITYQSQHSLLSKNAFCPGCGLVEAPGTVVQDTLQRFLERAGDEPAYFSDGVLTACECPQCHWQPDPKHWLGKRAKSVPDSLLRCPQCAEQSVQVKIAHHLSSDHPSLALLNENTGEHAAQVAWLRAGNDYLDRL